MEDQPRLDADHRFDVVIVGGGAAGLGAALQLARSRRSVIVLDAGEPRNAPAAHMHSYLGHDGRPPGEFLAIGRDEVGRYGAEIVAGRATVVTRDPDGNGFIVVLADGGSVAGRRLLVATGLVDELPAIPGVVEQWGRGVIHCPYCHGWEVQDRAIAVIATGPMATHQALLFRQLSDRITVIVHEPGALGPEDVPRLKAQGIRIEDGPVAAIAVEDDVVRGVRLADGGLIEADAVVVAPRFVTRSEVLRSVGIQPAPAPMGVGEAIETDNRGLTSVPGIYAAGNVTDVSHQVLQAAADGSRVGAAINADLADEDAALALASLPGDSADHWDERYGGEAQWWSGHPNATLVEETEHLEPGRALDVGCGEGADAIWLAQRGWDVTGLDISEVAIDRARGVARDAGVEVDWVRADIAVEPPAPAFYDLVSVHYPALPHTPDSDAMHAIIDAVAPGGTLLVVGHDLDAKEHHERHGRDPADYVQPADVAARLDALWAVEIHETRPRIKPPGSRGPDVPDIVLRARRTDPHGVASIAGSEPSAHGHD